MLFNSTEFLIFFPVVLLLYFILPARIRYIWLLVSSYYFYMCWNPLYSILIALSTVITYLCGRIVGGIKEREDISEEKQRSIMKLAIAGSFITNLGILIYFKYANFLSDSINLFLEKLEMGNLPSFRYYR